MFKTSEGILQDWAAANGLKLVSVEPGAYSQSRFLFTSRSEQEYRITVRDQAGALKSGAARCVRTGISRVDVKVRWDA